MTSPSSSIYYYAFVLDDPTGDLPEDSVGFSFSERGVKVVDGETQEHHCLWAWDAVYGVLPIRDSDDPTDMELFCISVLGVGNLQLECNDAFALAKAFCDNAPAGVSPDAPEQPPPSSAYTRPAPRRRLSLTLGSGRRGSGRRDAPSPAPAPAAAEAAAAAAAAAGEDSFAPPPPASICARGGPRGSVAALVVFVVGGLVAYCAVLDEHVDARTGGSVRPPNSTEAAARVSRRWTAVDALYFATTTVATVGYGDLYPTTPAGRAFTCFFAFFGVFGVGFAVGSVGNFVRLRAEARREQQTAEMIRNTRRVDKAGEGGAPGTKGKIRFARSFSTATLQRMRLARQGAAVFARHTRWLRRCLGLRKRQVVQYYRYAKALAPLVPVLGAGLLLAPIEGWSLGEAFYVACVTLTSVGFGDYSPATQLGRLFAVFYIPLGIFGIFRVIAKLVEVRMLGKNKAGSIKEILKMDKNGDGEVNCGEFQLFMLKAMGKVKGSDLALLRQQFRVLDKSGDGMLSAEDITAESEKEAEAVRKIKV
jgi:potassium channel subfamily K, other eukaryote